MAIMWRDKKKKAQGLAVKTNNVQKEEEEDEENRKKGKQERSRRGLAGGFPPVLVPTKIG
ncbi:hypothetical protein H5410_052212 [Solanum commersonii]|uniref:Uncharacterized protein n=1 Tax=Solanum commersonii TaxID=4109 RepID=A0A9J5X076_SOLCO|nr:hypothetical protein H5410_052212 [Solanum commersonii]